MPLTLKQRLAALSTTPSSPGFEAGTSMRSPLKSLFTAPWTRRQQGIFLSPDSEDVDMVADVMAKMVFQAGVDYETRPMVVMNASALPDPREVNYDLLLSRILSYLNLYVEADYTVVFFAAGGRHTPGWNWVWKAYRSLSRKYRKNLKRLYIVHSSFFTKMLFSLAGAVISPKFFAKITYVDALSELACCVPLTQIDIAPAVYQENAKHEDRITLPTPVSSATFGVHLEEIMGVDGEKGGIPRVVRDCIQYLRETGMEEEGLFRRSPSAGLLRAAKDAYDRGNVVSLDTFGDPHLAAVLLKKYLRDLPEPIFPESLYPTIRRCPQPTNDPADMTAVLYIREMFLTELPPCVYILLSHILHLLHEVSIRSASNRMDAHNLAVVLCPNLVKGSNPGRDVMMCSVPGGPSLYEGHNPSSPPHPPSPSNAAAITEHKTTLGSVVKLATQRYYEVFDEVRDRGEAYPVPDDHIVQEEPVDPEQQRWSVATDGSIDDSMLVMPIGPDARPNGHPYAPRAPASTSPSTPWQRTAQSRESNGHARKGAPRSLHTTANGASPGGGYNATVSRARSTISVERTTAGRRSISVGHRGTTTRKSAGSGVEAMGVTAEGFFAPPPPPVPPLPRGTGT